MNIMSLTRDQVKELVDKGWLNKKALMHYDVCKAAAQGKTSDQIAVEFDYCDGRQIRWIKQHKCPNCPD